MKGVLSGQRNYDVPSFTICRALFMVGKAPFYVKELDGNENSVEYSRV